jgi:hypothetical protein
MRNYFSKRKLQRRGNCKEGRRGARFGAYVKKMSGGGNTRRGKRPGEGKEHAKEIPGAGAMA